MKFGDRPRDFKERCFNLQGWKSNTYSLAFSGKLESYWLKISLFSQMVLFLLGRQCFRVVCSQARYFHPASVSCQCSRMVSSIVKLEVVSFVPYLKSLLTS